MRPTTTPVTTLWRGLRDEVRRDYPAGRIVLAVDGMDGAGKTTFADGFAHMFAEDGVSVFRASIDGFHRPREERHARGRTSPEGFYLDSYDYANFRRALIDPFRAGGSTRFQLAAFDVVRDAVVEPSWATAPKDAVLIVDGIFLHRRELRGIWHWSLWLDVPIDVAYERMAVRDGSDPDSLAPSNARYRLGHELYLRDARPRAAASVIVDNTDFTHPRRVYQDYC
jgi:Uridine kinase